MSDIGKNKRRKLRMAERNNFVKIINKKKKRGKWET